MDKKIFFAGEHTAKLYGIVRGAYESGLREAEKIIKDAKIRFYLKVLHLLESPRFKNH
ncbi:MAG: hypothetical protein EAZ08_14325, partial [Cytophagales bacterium]